MRKILFSLAAVFLAVGASAQSLKFASVGYPYIYMRFALNGEISPTEQSDTADITNSDATCALESRSFPGNTMDSTGKYGYEYRVTINDNDTINTNIVKVTSLALEFSEPLFFPYGGHASNQLWVVTSGGPDGTAPSSASSDGEKVFVSFNPPITLDTSTNQSISSLYFGMMSSNAPEMTAAILTGSIQSPTNGPAAFKLSVQAQTP